jgi:septum formation protein
MQLILASASPRRRELCERLGLSFTVIPAENEPPVGADIPPEEAVLATARAKAQEIASQYPQDAVLGADTVVAARNEAGDEVLLGKPQDAADAARMLRLLQGAEHRVLTAVWLCTPDGERGFTATTKVRFYPMSEADIAAYIATNEPMDKAGGYGIQGIGMRYIEGIEGDYYTVMGLPTARTYRLLREMAPCLTEN